MSATLTRPLKTQPTIRLVFGTVISFSTGTESIIAVHARLAIGLRLVPAIEGRKHRNRMTSTNWTDPIQQLIAAGSRSAL